MILKKMFLLKHFSIVSVTINQRQNKNRSNKNTKQSTASVQAGSVERAIGQDKLE